MPVWIGKIERDKGTADIRQSLSMWKNICGRLCSPELSFYRFSLTPAGRRTPAMPGTPIPYVPSSPGDLRRRASVGRQSVSCFHTQPVGDTHGSLFTPTSPTLRAAVPVLRPVPRLPPACFYSAIFPFITKIVRLGRFTFYCFHQCRRTAGHPRSPARRHPTFRSSPGGLRRRASVSRQSVSCFHTQPVGDTHGSLFTPTSPTLRAAVPVLRPVPRLPPAYFYNAIFPFITKIVRLGRFTFYCFHQRWRTAGHPRSPARRHPTFRSSPGGLRRRASVGRQSVSCFHTQPVGDTHGSLFAPTVPALRAAVPVLRPVPRLPSLPLVIRPFIEILRHL
ncbi:MAG: hypothetical protein PARBB_02613 [Parabacteroides distasonis]